MDAHRGAVLAARWSLDGSALATGRLLSLQNRPLFILGNNTFFCGHN